MIQSKEDYLFFLEADRLGRGRWYWNRNWHWYYGFTNETWAFQRLLRKVEYHKNCRRSVLGGCSNKLLSYRFMHLSTRLGFTIPPNVFGPGLCLLHRGTIVVSDLARVGENCAVRQCVTIGVGSRDEGMKAPQIGINVFIGPGAVLIGDIRIADGIAIGANSVVNRSFLEEGTTIAGVPARKVSNKGSEDLFDRGTELARDRAKAMHSNT